MHLSSYILCICIHLMTICLELFRLKASSTLRNFFGTVFVCNCPKRVACWQLNFSSCRASWWNRSSSIAKWLTSLRPFTGDTCDAHKRQMEGNHWYSHTNMHTATKIITLATQKILFFFSLTLIMQLRNCWDGEGGETMPPPPPQAATAATTLPTSASRLIYFLFGFDLFQEKLCCMNGR